MDVLSPRHAGHSAMHHSTFAIILWLTIASIIALPLILRVCRLLGLHSLARQKYSPVNGAETDDSPARRFSERLSGLANALSALQFHPRLRFSHATQISVARAVVLSLYIGLLVLLFLLQLAVDGKIPLERAGFRLAWLAIAHLPLVLILSLRFNVVAFAFGISAERLNWCHRWAAAVFIILSFLHGLLFIIEWVSNNFFRLALEVMPSVLHGMVAIAIQIWVGFSSFAPIRRLSYEVFKVQHLVFPPVLLYFLWVHTHNSSRLITIFSVYLLLLDSVSRCAVLLYRNVRVFGRPAYNRLGFSAHLEALCPDITVITIDGVDFEWTAGQHVYVWLPIFWAQSMHPFTIAKSYTAAPDNEGNTRIRLVCRTKTGFTRKINQHATEIQRLSHCSGVRCRAFLSGPFGNPPNLDTFPTVVFIASATGASFTLPLFEKLVENPVRVHAQRIRFLLTGQRCYHLKSYLSPLSDAVEAATSHGWDVSADIFISSTLREPQLLHDGIEMAQIGESSPSGAECRAQSTTPSTVVSYHTGRPDIITYLADAVSGSAGDVALVLCGSAELTEGVCKAVSKASPERIRGGSQSDSRVVLYIEQRYDK